MTYRMPDPDEYDLMVILQVGVCSDFQRLNTNLNRGPSRSQKNTKRTTDNDAVVPRSHFSMHKSLGNSKVDRRQLAQY